MRRALGQQPTARKSGAFWAPRVAALVLTFVAATAAAQNLTITPTTTYATETGVNTSEPAGFTSQTDGNLGGANISKVDTHTLLYPGFNGKIYAHVVGWFGGSNHENIGYNSSDPAVVKAQINDMVSRGIDGIIHVWYGSGSNISNLEAQAVMNEAANHPGFTFAIMIDKGAIQWDSCYPTCTATQALTNLTTYVANTYFSSPSYLRINGRPVITNFDIDSAYSVDWNQVAANTPGNPIFLFQNNSGFTHTQSGGSYSWVMPSDSNYGLDYLGSFYSTGASYPTEQTVGATYKGFNDTLASWTMNRIMSQQCGQTWLSTFSKINSMYNSTSQLPILQLVTWDDYEEGTEIETGIDNCVSVNASVSGTVLNWAISGGNENTIDHYTVFISTDGQNLMSLGDFAAGVHSVDIATFNPAAGTYTLYVKAIGKPSIANKMSNAATLSVMSSGDAVTVTPSTGMAPLTVTATATSASTTTNAANTTSSTSPSTTIDFGDGTVATGSTASHTYTTPGNYTVKATFVSSTGSTSTATTTVQAAAAAPNAVLSLSATSAVAPATISASTAASTDSNAGATITGSVINWGDGASSAGPSASHSYTAAGTYTVTATVTDSYGISATATQILNIAAAGVTITSPTNGSSPSSPVQVTATAASGVGISAMTTYVDYNKMYTTNSASTNVSLALAPGSHLLAINAWDTTGKVMQATLNFTVPTLTPTATLSVSANTAVAPASIAATATGTDPNTGGSISSYSINWGDGTAADTTASASHTYATAGTYTVTATVTDNYGKSATATQTVTITTAAAPTVTLALSSSSATAPATITATASATDPNAAGTISSYSINWGDGSAAATTASATHTYSTAGTYTVTATATDNYGKTGTATQTLTVTATLANPTAVLTLSATTGVAPAAITASTSGSTDPNAGATMTSTIAWGDGASSAGPSASHTYTVAGTYTVTATVSDNYGKSATQSKTVTVSAAGVTITSPTTGSTPDSPVHVLATAASGNGIAAMTTYVDYNKMYSTNSATTDTTLALAPGSHLLAINAWDSTGAVMQSSVTFTVPALAPTAALSLSATSAPAPATITATASGTDPNVSGSISSYAINWGDGTTTTGASGSHTYSTGGTYTVTATVTDNYGKTASASQSVTVAASVAPTAALSVSMSGPTATVTTAGSSAGSGSITSTVINWGDGSTTTAASGSHTYAKGGYYTITVQVTNSYGLSSTASQQVTAAGVVIWLPQPGTTSSQPVHIAATAYDSRAIASMIIYLDGNKVWTGYVSDFDVWLNMRSGTHTIVVKAWEAVSGTVYQSSVTFKAK